MLQCQIPISENFPVDLVLLTDGQAGLVAFVKTRQFTPIFDMSASPEENAQGVINAVFYPENFTIGEEEYQYATAYPYKEIPEMLKWLQDQNLQEPNIIAF